jgi:hypothetical protein
MMCCPTFGIATCGRGSVGKEKVVPERDVKGRDRSGVARKELHKELHPRDPLCGTVADAMVTIPKTMPIWSTVGEARKAFDDEHVHMLLLTNDGYLYGTLLREDLGPGLTADSPALAAARSRGRTTGPDMDLGEAFRSMVAHGRRRIAVVGSDNRLLGLLCLKRNLNGFCSDSGITARAWAHQKLTEEPGACCHPRCDRVGR